MAITHDQLLDSLHSTKVGVAEVGLQAFTLYGELYQQTEGYERFDYYGQEIRYAVPREWWVTLTVLERPDTELYHDRQDIHVVTDKNGYSGTVYLTGVQHRPSGLWRLTLDGVGAPKHFVGQWA